jgi:hypothetical protein
MSEDPKLVWPAGVPDTLWNFELLRPATERPFPLPMLGFKPDWLFLGYFAIGMLIVLVFAWRRFSVRKFDASQEDYEVLQKLAPAQLRGSTKMWQAYSYYAAILLLIYAAFAFFGNVILALVNSTNIAGLQVDFDPSSVSSRTWPIMLALAFAGFGEVFKPLDSIEEWLRHRTHYWVGIPIRIVARTEILLHSLDKSIVPILSDKPAEKAARQGPQSEESDKAKTGRKIYKLPSPDWLRDDIGGWARTQIDRQGGVRRLAQKVIQLQEMVALVREPGAWPDINLLEKVKPVAKSIRTEAEAALRQMEDILMIAGRMSPAPRKPPTSKYSEASSPDNAVSDPLPETDKDAGDGLAVDPRSGRRQLALLESSINRVIRSRRETAALLAVYAERDKIPPDFEGVAVGDAIKAAFPFVPRTDTAFWVAILLLPIFFLYTVMTGLHMHGLLGNVKLSTLTVLATATAETLRLVAIFLLPLAAVLALRGVMKEDGRWEPLSLAKFNRTIAFQSVVILVVSGLVAVVGILAVCVGWAGAIAENPDRLRTILLSPRIAMLSYFLCFFVSAMAFTLITTWAIDSLLVKSSKWNAFKFGLCSALLIGFLMGVHLVVWNASSCSSLRCMLDELDGKLARVSTFEEFYRQFNLTDFVAYFAISFLSASVFAWPASDTGEQGVDAVAEANHDNVSFGGHRAAATMSMVILMAFAGFAIFAGPASAQDSGRGPKESSVQPADEAKSRLYSNRNRVVYLGVRTNAEPFSYKAGKGQEDVGLAYRGYSVDMCYQILEAAGYQVEFVRVTVQDRFQLIRKEAPGDGNWTNTDKRHPVVDVLCEPTTLRFNRSIEKSKGIFSPIIFATGVSSIMRSSHAPYASDTYFAYVEGTTAGFVADKACTSDMFALYDEQQPSRTDCEPDVKPIYESFRDGRMLYVKNCDPTTVRASSVNHKDADGDSTARYYVCAFENHDDAIEWFCKFSDDSLNARIVYFGDQEIIRAKLASARAKGRCPEKGIEEQSTSYTYEPYALLMSNTDPELVQVVQRGVYDFFSHRSKATGLFSTYFPGAEMSQVLAYLFLLNAVEREEYFQVPYLERDRSLYSSQKGAYLQSNRQN